MSESTVEGVKKVLVTSLGIEDRESSISAATPLFGEMPELDSLAVVELAAALEDHFGITINDDDFTGELFETVGTLAAFVESQRA
ncbi:MAG: acyl carrier protein [Microthrixaceae bacterium]